jgi:hypothetical protein
LRGAASLLPIPDPEIVRLSGPAFERGNNDKLIETIWAERTLLFIAEQIAGKNPQTRDEIWLVVGPESREGETVRPNGERVGNGVIIEGIPGGGGLAPHATMPWTAATAPYAEVTAHEIGHMALWTPAHNNHVNLCGAVGGDSPSPSYDGRVRAIGWDMWNNRPRRGTDPTLGAVDLMSYCWAQRRAWMSPHRWRQIFLSIGP